MTMLLTWILAVLDTGVAICVGLSGPVCERRPLLVRLPFPFSFPDALLTFPLFVALTQTDRDDFLSHIIYPPAYWAGIASLAAVMLLAAGQFILTTCTRKLPGHLRFLADCTLEGRHWRSLIRLCTWQGILLVLPPSQRIVLAQPWLLIAPMGLLTLTGYWIAVHGKEAIAIVSWFRNPFQPAWWNIGARRRWNWFFSYKSDESTSVRAVVDRLVAAGAPFLFCGVHDSISGDRQVSRCY